MAVLPSRTPDHQEPDKVLVGVSVLGLLLTHAALLGWIAYRQSPVDNEVAHLASGLSHLELGRFDLYRVNPPLVRAVSAAPLFLGSQTTTWRSYDSNPLNRSEVPVGLDLLCYHGARSYWLVTLARWACIPFSLLGQYSCFRWARMLFGARAGLLAMLLWCFSPWTLGNSSLITPDAHAAALGVTAGYCFWRWLKKPDWIHALAAGLALGVAELAKFTLLVLYPSWLTVWLLYRVSEHRDMSLRRWLRESAMVAFLTVTSLVVINMGYCFEGTFQYLRDFQFQSVILTAGESHEQVSDTGSNRFAGTWLGRFPVPVPKNYLQGIDTQKRDFDRRKWSYMEGRWRMGGWWYYYLYALAVKVPLGTWALLALAIAVSFLGRSCVICWRDELILLVPAIAILVLVSSQTGFSIHARYVLPALPFLFVWIGGKVAHAASQRHRLTSLLACLALCYSVVSSLAAYPHSFGYYNEFAGGPANGHIHLLGGNTSWGQDVLFLKSWLDDHPEAQPLMAAISTAVDPRLAGIEFTLPPIGPRVAHQDIGREAHCVGPLPGWYAIDVNHIQETPLGASDGRGGWRSALTPSCSYGYFRRLVPVARAGYSIHIFHITLEQANRLRRELGLAELKEENVENGLKTEG